MRRALLAALAFLLAPPMARAELHTQIDAHAVVEFDRGRVVALRMGWRFEQESSRALVRRYDRDGDGVLSKDEIALLARETFESSREADYFTHARIDGQPVVWPPATQFAVATLGGSLVFSFRLPLPEPVDPRGHVFAVATYDEMFRSHIEYPDPGAVRVAGEGSDGCSVTMKPDTLHPLLDGRVVPIKAEISCAPR